MYILYDFTRFTMSAPDLNSKRKYLDERLKQRDAKDFGGEELFLIESYQSKFFSEKSEKYENILYDESDIFKDEHEESNAYSCLRIFEQHLKIKDKWNISDVLPRGTPLSSSLYTDQYYTRSWNQPVMMKQLVPERMTHMLIPMNDYNNKQLSSGLSRLSSALNIQSRSFFHSLNAPCFIQTMKIPRQAYFDLIQAKKDGKKYHTVVVKAEDPTLIDIPVGITYSDGYTTTLTVKFPWERIPEDTHGQLVPSSQSFTFTFSEMPAQIMEFMKARPIVYMDNADHQQKLLSSFLEDFYGVNFKLKVFDLGSLAVAAGCRMDNFDIFSLSVICNGNPFPVGIEFMDQRWAWEDTEQPLLIWYYLEKRLRIMVEIYQVLMGTLIRNLFPDPDIVLYSLRMTQDSFNSWFSYFIAKALVNTCIDDTDSICDAKTRAELLRSIKVGVNPLLENLADMYTSVPVPQCGGERYLHHARHIFFNQFAVIERIHLPDYMCEQPTPRPDMFSKRYELMFKREYVIDDSGEPCLQIDLQPSPQFSSTVYEFHIDNALKEDIKIPRPQYDRQIIPALCEWGRLDLANIHSLLSKLTLLDTKQASEFWVQHIRAYDYMRGCLLRLREKKTCVRVLDLVLTKREDNTRAELKRIEDSVPGKLPKRRMDFLNDKGYYESEDKVGLSQTVYEALPGKNTERNRQWARERKARMNTLKRHNPDALSNRQFRRAKQLRVMREVSVAVGEKQKCGVGEANSMSSNSDHSSRIVTDYSQPSCSSSEPSNLEQSITYDCEDRSDSPDSDDTDDYCLLKLKRLQRNDVRHLLSRHNPTYKLKNYEAFKRTPRDLIDPIETQEEFQLRKSSKKSKKKLN